MKMKRIIISIICMILFNACSDTETENIKYTEEYTVVKNIKYALNIKNNTGRDLKKSKVLLYAPVEKSSSQRIVSLNVNQAHKIYRDDVGNQIISVSFENIIPEKEGKIIVEAELQIAETPNLIREASIATYQNINRSISAEEQALIESMIQSLKAKKPIRVLQEIASWVEQQLIIKEDEQLIVNNGMNLLTIQSIDIGRVSLAKNQGSVRGNANILLDLAKTAGIPVRWVLGVSKENDGKIELADAQLWLQFMISDKWHLFNISTKKEIDNYTAMVLLRVFPGYIDREFKVPSELLYETIGVEKQ